MSSSSTRIEQPAGEPRSIRRRSLDLVSALVPPVESWRHRKADEYAEQAAKARAAGNLAEAEAHYLQALDWQPADAKLRSSLGQLYYQLGRPEEAKLQFKQALNLDYNDQNALSGLAVILQEQGNSSDAMYYYRRYLEQNPKDGFALLNLGAIFHTSGDFERAIEYYRRAEECGTNLPLVSRNHALALFSLGRVSEAVPLLQQAVAAAPQDAELQRLLGQALEAAGDLEGAMNSYHRAIELNPQDPNAQASLALGLNRQGHVKESLEPMQRAAELSENGGDQKAAAFAWWNLASIQYQLQNFEASVECCTKALKLNPDLVAVNFSLGLVLLHLGRSAEARENYEKAMNSAPVSDLEMYGIGDLQNAINVRPDLAGAAEILKMLQDKYAAVQQQYLAQSAKKQA